MTTPTCRMCHAATLDSNALCRFLEEPVTMPVFLCPEHKAINDAQHEAFNRTFEAAFLRAETGERLTFTRTTP